MDNKRHVGHLSRREILTGGVVAAAMLCSGVRAAAPTVAERIVDTHHHFYPPRYVAKRRSDILAVGPGFPHIVDWTPQQSLAAMDQAGIAKSILSMSAPGIWFGGAAESAATARECNEYAADLVHAYPGRFGFFAALPLPDPQASVAEIGYALDHLHADGIGLLTNYDSRYLGDPLFEPVMAELHRRAAVVYTHPAGTDCCHNIDSGLPMASMEFPFDTTRTIASLAFKGTLNRFPDIRFIFSHGGGTVPFLVGRMGSILRTRTDLAALFPDGLQAALARHFYDTVSIIASPSIKALTDFVPTGNLLFGTDYPYNAPSAQLEAFGHFNFSAAERAAVLGQNAARLLAGNRSPA
jgi:6-methylsalicylate decarboxylase